MTENFAFFVSLTSKMVISTLANQKYGGKKSSIMGMRHFEYHLLWIMVPEVQIVIFIPKTSQSMKSEVESMKLHHEPVKPSILIPGKVEKCSC
jgi:hypothetical protein